MVFYENRKIEHYPINGTPLHSNTRIYFSVQWPVGRQEFSVGAGVGGCSLVLQFSISLDSFSINMDDYSRLPLNSLSLSPPPPPRMSLYHETLFSDGRADLHLLRGFRIALCPGLRPLFLRLQGGARHERRRRREAGQGALGAECRDTRHGGAREHTMIL